MPRWVGDVLEAIFIIGLGAIVFAIFFFLFSGGSTGSGALTNSGGLGYKIKGYADSVVNDAQKDIKGIKPTTVAPRFSNVLSFLLR